VSAGLLAPVLTGEGTWRTPTRLWDGRLTFQRLPIEPLEREMERRGGYYSVDHRVDGAKRVRLGRAWERAKITRSLTWKAADQFAVELLLVHPYEIWGFAWFGLQD
jgi:hypothetical protein